MSIGIGIIGAGIMGADHARIVARETAGAHLVAISDADEARANAVAGEHGAPHAVNDPDWLIKHPDVGAVLIASPDQTHAAYTLACLEAGKPVLCEKPLAPNSGDCLKVVEAEVATGRRLVQVGFMRRFDPAYNDMKETLDSGRLGPALMLHCAHRNATVPGFFDAGMSISNSCVHEIDIIRWLLATEFTRVQVMKGRRSPAAKFDDPLLVVFETEGGQIADVELFLNAQYGYDIKGELVCERGTMTLAPPAYSEIRADGRGSYGFAPDWRPRFAAAYRLQMQTWVSSITTRQPAGSSAWDGYVATAVAEAGHKALASGQWTDIRLEKRPALYT